MSVAATRTIRTYARMYHIVRRSLEKLKDEPIDGFSESAMTSILLTAFMMEASLNHFGESLLKSWGSVERNLSPKSKAELLSELLKLPADFSTRPYQSFQKLFQIRNALVHGKTEILSGTITTSYSEVMGEAFHTVWEKECSRRVAERLFEDVLVLIKSYWETTGNTGDPFAVLGTHSYQEGA